MHNLTRRFSLFTPGRRLLPGAVALLTLLSGAVPASAQISRIGVNPLLASGGVLGTDVAYDPVNEVYLAVGAHGGLIGAFTSTSGDQQSLIHINNSTGGFAHFPRVAYSPHVSDGAGGFGGFLVTWHENAPASNQVHLRIVAYPNRLVTPVTTIPSSATAWFTGAAVAYSPVSQVFMVTWQATDYNVWASRVGTNGQPVGGLIEVSEGGAARDPNVAWNPVTNEFGIIFTGFGGGTHASFARVSPSGTVLQRSRFHNTGVGTFITDIAVGASGRYVGVWHEQAIGTLGAEIDAAGNVLALGFVSSEVGTVSHMALAYNAHSGTFLLVGQGAGFEVWGAELNARGARNGSSIDGGAGGGSTGGSTGGCPGTTPFPGAICVNGGWIDGGAGEVLSSSSTGGGPNGSLGSVSPPPSTDGSSGGSTGGCPGTTPFPGAVCVNGGWIDGGSGGGSTGGCPGTTPFPGAVCVNGGWIDGGAGGGSGGGSTVACPGTTPFPGAICVNGGWIPGGL